MASGGDSLAAVYRIEGMRDWTSLEIASASVLWSSPAKGGNWRIVSRRDHASLVHGYTEAKTSMARCRIRGASYLVPRRRSEEAVSKSVRVKMGVTGERLEKAWSDNGPADLRIRVY